jgi:uncharacterized protein (DUF1501 family)
MKHPKPNERHLRSHDSDHAQWDRRGFLRTLGMAGAGAISFGSSTLSVVESPFLNQALSDAYSDRILVLIRLKGGNDGLNTIVPLYDFDLYANNRPKIHIPQNQLIKLNDDFAMPNFMVDIDPLWKQGAMKVIHGVGYENQNLSHFKSSEIWATTTHDSDINSGWMGRYYEGKYMDYLSNPPEKPLAIQIGGGENMIFGGDLTTYSFSVSSPQRLKRVAENGTLFDNQNNLNNLHGQQVSFLREASNTTFRYASVINQAYENSRAFDSYANNNFDLQLSLVSRFIKGGLGTKVYMVSLGGFDTHANQPGRHESLMKRLTKAIKVFYSDLSDYGMADKVLSMTFSEFGRRVAENGSKGTDHGSAAPIMLFGPALKGNGFIGKHPNLNVLDKQGNMLSNIDFRAVYASVLTDWLCADPVDVNNAIVGPKPELLGLGLGCDGSENLTTTDDPILPLHAAVNQDQGVSLYLSINELSKIEINVFDVLGRKVGNTINSYLNSGKHNLSLVDAAAHRLPPGQYFYKITVNGDKTYSKSFLVQ